jgi:hypothetical protein
MNPQIDGSSNDDGINPIFSAMEAGKIVRAKLRASMEGASSTTQALSDEGDVRVPMDDQGNVAEMDNDNNNDDDDDERPGEFDGMDNGGEDSDEEESDNEEDDDNEDDEDVGSDYEEIDDEIVEKFILTFHKGNYDAEFDDALILNRSETLPNEPTQASYIKPDNWVERNRIGLEKTREQLQSCIESVLLGNTFELNLTHNTDYHDTLMDNEEPIVWHEPILDEYWGRFEEEIDARRQVDIVDICDINIENVEMKKERLAALVAMFVSGRATNSSTHVYFSNANLCGEGIISLSKLVEASSMLDIFSLCHNWIDNMKSVRCLSRSLRNHDHISWLHLTHCDLGSSPEILLLILQSDVKCINLAYNNIDSLGAVKIAQYLESDPPIKHLMLDCNCLNDNDAKLMSQALKRNTKLKTLTLHTNNFTSIGVKALLNCVFDSSTLNAIAESNHTLYGIYFFDDDNNRPIKGLNYWVLGIDRLLGFDQTQKIMLALQDKDSLLQYLANVPVGLMPEVLAFPRHQDVDICKTMNLVYSIMRYWNMPVLYCYHCVKSDAKRKRDVRDCCV